MQKNLRIGTIGPFDNRIVVMRMRYRDRTESATSVDLRHCSIVQQHDAIPEEISSRRLHQQSALADSEFGLGANAWKSRRLFFETVSMIGRETLERRPFLAAMTDDCR